MSDNLSVTPGWGETVAAENLSGVLVQRVKMVLGDLDADGGDVSTTNSMPVSLSSSSSLPSGTNTVGKVQVLGNTGAVLDQAPGSAAPANAVQIGGSDGTNLRALSMQAKGTQGTYAVSTQDQKDTGRTSVVFYANAVASGSTGVETAITLSLSSGTSAVTTGSSFVVTSGKTLRINSIILASRGNATATAQITTFSLRLSTSGAVTTTTTPVLFGVTTATPATVQAWDRCVIDIPDGYEIAGNGSVQIGLTANAVFSSNAPTWFATITGYYY